MNTDVKSWSAQPVLEPVEPRLLLDGQVALMMMAPPLAYDVAVQVNFPSGQSFVPGDRIDVPIVLTNMGTMPLNGRVLGELFASEDAVLSADDHWTDDGEGTLDMMVGETIDYTFSYVLPPEATPGGFYMICEITVLSGFTDQNLANNVAASGGTSNVAWRFGTFDGHKNYKVKVKVDNGPVVSFALTGGGWGEIDNDDLDNVILHDTTAASAMAIVGPAGYDVPVGNITVLGPLKSLTGKTTDLRGSLLADGVITSLTLKDVDVGHLIEINRLGPAPTDPKVQCAVTLAQVWGTSLEMNGVPLKSLTVTEWLGGEVNAPWLGALQVKGNKKIPVSGNFEADLTLDAPLAGKPALGSAKIAGDLGDASWSISGAVGAIDVKMWIEWCDFTGLTSLKSLKAAGYEDSEMTVTGPVGSFTVGPWWDSDLTADSLGSLKSGEFDRGRLRLNGTLLPADKPVVLKSAKVGNITDSALLPDTRGWVLYGDVGSVTTGNVTDWYLSLHSNLASLKMGIVENATVEVDDGVGNVQAVKWFGGALTADSAKSIKITGDKKADLAGDLSYVNLTLTGEGVDSVAGKPALGTLSIAGMMDHAVAKITGHVGAVSATIINKSDLLIGCTGLTNNVSDFSDGHGGLNQFELKSLSVKGEQETPADPFQYITSSNLGVWLLKALKFGQRPTELSGTLEVHDINLLKMTNPPVLGAPGVTMDFWTVG